MLSEIANNRVRATTGNAECTGVPRVLRGTRRRFRGMFRRGVIVLVYHRIGSTAHDPDNLVVSPARFAEQLDVLKRWGVGIPTRDLPALLAQRRFPRRGYAITFDDGYVDNLTCAKPLLEKAATPATVFVSSGFTSTGKPFPWDESLTGMSRAQLREISDSGLIDIGGHTHNHPRLGELQQEEQAREIAQCKGELEEFLGKKISTFAYPFGWYGTDYTDTTKRLVSEAGYSCAFAVRPAPLVDESDVYGMPRCWVADWDGDEFARRLSDWYSR